MKYLLPEHHIKSGALTESNREHRSSRMLKKVAGFLRLGAESGNERLGEMPALKLMEEEDEAMVIVSTYACRPQKAFGDVDKILLVAFMQKFGTPKSPERFTCNLAFRGRARNLR